MSARARQSTPSSRASPNKAIAKETTSTKGPRTINGGRMRNTSSNGYASSPSAAPPPTPTKPLGSRLSRTPGEASTIKTLMPLVSGTKKIRDAAPTSSSAAKKPGTRVPYPRVIAPREASTKTLLTRAPSAHEFKTPQGKLVDTVPCTEVIHSTEIVVDPTTSTTIAVASILSSKVVVAPSPSSKVVVAPTPSSKVVVAPAPSSKVVVAPTPSTKVEVAPTPSTTMVQPEPILEVTPAPPPPVAETTPKDEPLDEPRDISLDFDYTSVYTPQLYTFKDRDGEVGPDAELEQLPPYWMLMDHMLAVLWCLNSPRHKNIPLSISQLQWALYILSAIKTRRGEQTKDVSVLIDMIQDRLLDSYASIAKTSSSQDAGHKSKSINTTKRGVNARKEEAKKKSATDMRPPQSSALSSFEDVEQMMRTNKRRQLPVCPYGQNSTRTTRSRPASIGYDEIVLRSPPNVQGTRRPMAIRSRVVCRRKLVFENIDAAEVDYSTTNESTTWVPSRPQTPVQFTKPLETATVTVDEMMSFMHQWRAGQVQRIKSEMTHLRSIEEFMTKVNPNTFEPYVQGRLAKRLKEIERKMSPSNYIRSLDSYSY